MSVGLALLVESLELCELFGHQVGLGFDFFLYALDPAVELVELELLFG